jgi:hypothetical protein
LQRLQRAQGDVEDIGPTVARAPYANVADCRMTPKIPITAAITVAILLALGGQPALGQPSDREQARDKMAEGVRLLSARDFAKALARFNEAYVLFPSPKLHYNRGLALNGLGRRADAFVSFSRFVNETKDPSPEYLKHANRELERLKGLIGFLEISTETAGAEVRVDAERVGVTPLANALPVEPGAHDVSLQAPGFGDTVQRVSIAAGERVKVKVDLRSNQLTPPRYSTPADTRGALDVAAGRKADVPTSGGPADEPGSGQATSWRRPAAWAALAAGAGALGFGIYETFVFRSRRSEFDNLTEPDPMDPMKRLTSCGSDEPRYGRNPACATLYSRGQTALTLSIVGYAAAAALGGVSVFLFSRPDRPNEGARTAWACGLGRLSASCQFSF